MGATESVPAASVTSGVADPSFDQKTSGLRITGVTGDFGSELSTEERIKQAYSKGKEDGINTFQSSLEQVAAQVYDSVHSRLTAIQTESLEKSSKLVSGVTGM